MLALLLSGCDAPQKGLEKATLSLDWVPNTNHTGFYTALEKGWYAEEGIDLNIQIPSDPSAALKQVAAGQTEFGVSFQEELTIARSTGIPVISIGTIIQHNTSAFAVLVDSGITRPRDFEGKLFASSGLPIEKPILSAMMACDGGDINKVEFVDVGFDLLPALFGKHVDIVWLFEGWDGINAGLMGQELTTFPLYGDCVPDYYTPVVVAGEATLKDKSDLVTRFMRATARGYEYAAANPAEAADILLKHAPESDAELVRASQVWISPRYIDDASAWGQQKPKVWQAFTDWMVAQGLLEKPIDTNAAFTNDYLPK